MFQKPAAFSVKCPTRTVRIDLSHGFAHAFTVAVAHIAEDIAKNLIAEDASPFGLAKVALTPPNSAAHTTRDVMVVVLKCYGNETEEDVLRGALQTLDEMRTNKSPVVES